MSIKTFTKFYLFITGMTLLHACDDEERPRLTADFTSDKQNVVAGEAVNFSDESAGNPSKWNWTFEGGTPSTSILHSPSVTYGTPGTYSVKLIVGRANDSTSISREEFIVVGYPDVTADFTADRTTAIEGESISFADASAGFPTSWSWEFIHTDGEIIESAEENPVITFSRAGIYSVKLISSNPVSSDEEVKADYLTIIDPTSVIADFTTVTQSTYAGGSVTFTDASQGLATAWEWTFEGGTPSSSPEQNPVVIYNTPGRYKVKLVTSNDSKSSTREVEQYILVIPGGDLAAFYPFDGNANDAGPNGVNASKTGDVSFDAADRNSLAKSASFSGNGVLISPDHSAFNFGTNDFSISCWVKTDVTSRMMLWMESGGINGSGDNQAWLRIGDNTTDRLARFAVEDNTGSKILNVGTANQPGGLSNGVWHHVVCVRQGLNSKVYIDGVLVKDEDASNVKNVSSSQTFKTGAQESAGGNTYSNYYNGLMDDLILYNKALTAQEVMDLFNL